MRIIPARAGFTVPGSEFAGLRRDHPRSRGVYGFEESAAQNRLGSSPLARGLPIPDRVQDVRIGIIPARAGFTPRAREDHNSWPDHPRSRGVYPPFWE